MKQIIIGFFLISTFSALAGEIACTTLNTDKGRDKADEIVQEHLNVKCDNSKPFSISEIDVDGYSVFTRVCCIVKN